jgi:Tol biopolymer transport system component
LKINAKTGEIEKTDLSSYNQSVYSPIISPIFSGTADNKYLYYVKGDDKSGIKSVIRRDLKSEKEEELYRTPDDNITMALSPDGKQMALLSRHKEDTRILKILSTMNGSVKDIHEFKLKEYRYISIAWSPDGRHIYFSKRDDSEDKWELCRIPAAGGTAENLGVKMHRFVNISIHPDGRRIAFASFVGFDKPGGIWVMENFLPEEKVARKPTFRKIKIASRPQNGVLSPDGNKLAFMADEAVWVVPLHGRVDPDIAGEPVRLAEVPGSWDWGSLIAWSADGVWIAVNGKANDEDAVYVVPVADGEPLVVQMPKRGGHAWSNRISLSPDGQILAFSALELGKSQEVPETLDRYIYTIPTTGGEAKQVSSGRARLPSFSPDGQLIAYVGYREREAWPDNAHPSLYHGDLWIVPSAGGTPVKLATVDGRLRGPVWSPDGKYIAAHHEPGGSNDSKEILVFPLSSDASSAGEPEKIELPRSSWNILAGWTPENELGVFMESERHIAIYTVPAQGGKAAQVAPVVPWSHYPSWSPDGRRIYFRGSFHDEKNVSVAYVPSAGGDPVQVSVQSKRGLVSRVPGGGHNVSPDGKKILFSAYQEPYNPKEGVDVWTIPLDGGSPTRLTSDESFEGYPCWSPDGEWIAFVDHRETSEKEDFLAIYVVPAEGGEIRQVSSESDNVGGGAIAFSPDGERIAFFSKGSIKTIPVEGGEPEVLVGEVKSDRHSQLAYSPDGSKIAHNARGKIWITSLDGGEPQELSTGLPKDAKLGEFSWSPDGEKMAFVASIGGEAEFWLIENFLPKSKTSE